MPDWLAPFHMPDFTDDEWKAQKAAHVAKHGYTITVPGLSDIIKIRIEEPMTFDEEVEYKRKNLAYFSPDRLKEIRAMKQRRKDRYASMLASPTPDIFHSAGSILTALDDCQDAISTLSCIGRMAIKAAPRFLGKLFTGPVGWLLLGNDIMNLVIGLGQTVTMPYAAKRHKESATGTNPFTKKARARRAKKLMNGIPTKGDIIQGLQTTNEVFGFGLSLGPVVGLLQDIVSGAVRASTGAPVKIKFPRPDFRGWYKRAQKTAKAVAILGGVSWHTDDDMMLEVYMAGYLAHQALMPRAQEWNPLEAIDDIRGAQCLAPVPTNPLTLEVIEEGPLPLSQICSWPGIGHRWANIVDISDAIHPVATSNLREFVERNNHNWRGYAGAALACETATYAIANLEGEEDVKYDFTAQSKAAGILLQNGLYPDPNQPREKLDLYVKEMDNYEIRGVKPTLRSIKRWCWDMNISLCPMEPGECRVPLWGEF